MTMHPDQLVVTLDVARRLIEEQFPHLVHQPLRRLPQHGTVHQLVRVGDDLVARFPLVPGEVEEVRQWVRREAAAARELVGRLRVPTPEPVGLGEPGHGYPLPWSLHTWLPGTPATPRSVAASEGFADDLADLLLDLRAVDTRGRTFDRPGRGGDLRAHDAWVAQCLARSEQLLDVPRLRTLWARVRALPRTAPDVMTHGDLTPSNLLVDRGRLVGVIDVGGFGPADPALDLVAGWHLLDGPARQRLRARLGSDDLEWDRGRAWALEQALGLVWYYERTNPTLADIGAVTITRILADDQD
jgi:aminoglycoside phosphotransferase (APT) family kinase protein